MMTGIINREYSWLNFNNRVLFEASKPGNPILEKLKFLSISASNLEEFFMIRVAVLKNQIRARISESGSFPGESPAAQIEHIRKEVMEMLGNQYKVLYNNIIPGLKENGIKLLFKTDELLPFKDELEPFFDNELEIALTPLSIGPTLPFVTLVTGRLYLAIGLQPITAAALEISNLSFVEIPANVFGRFYHTLKDNSYIPMENIIRLFIHKLYAGYRITSCHVVKITRDADISLQGEDAPNLLKEIETSIKRMHRRSAVRLEYENGIPESIKSLISTNNRLSEADLYPVDGILHLKDLMNLYGAINAESLKFKPVTPVYPRDFKGKKIFRAAGEHDILLFHPYHSYDPVVELISAAADDPDVIAIKQTLYRTSSESEIIKALIRAAENGKYVTVIDELKARFDEKRNIEWARKLEDAGAHVTYGVSGLKTHAKAMLIIRKEKSGIRRYVHLATGNYNENTARLYSDLSL
ncbi:MAG: polyphosphate kinase 1, partial [Brevinematales bacterium]